MIFVIAIDIDIEKYFCNFKTMENTSSQPLSKEQQDILDSQVNEDKSLYIDADKLISDLKDK